MQQCKIVVQGGLTIAEKRKDLKAKGEKERYTRLNAEFQRIAKRDKKAFLRAKLMRNREMPPGWRLYGIQQSIWLFGHFCEVGT